MNEAERKKLLAELTDIAGFIGRTYDHKTAEVARHALGLAADFVHAGQPVVAHLQTIRSYVQTRQRR